MSKPYLLLFIASLSWLNALAQDRCATEKFDSIRRGNNPRLESKDQFEQWMSSQLKKSGGANLRTQSAYVIPVVVHVVHNGEPIGTGTNISDAQVISQINVLNKDFQRLNADANQTPVEFQDEAGSIDVEFVLAKQDPMGNPTNGISRVNGGKSSWTLYQDAELKGKSYWPAEQYFNVWVANFPDYLGYTQFPVSNLPGVENSSYDRLTDGIIVHYQAFGSIDDGNFNLESKYDKGRTLTHEAGHFFGMRHIWGDANSCSATDYVSDTPPQIGSTSNCPANPQPQCSGNKMFQNYMDYTDDRCMNIFTTGQLNRMITVLQNSPRRASLLTSPGSLPPGSLSLDLGITSTNDPTSLECSGTHTPTITIRNFGTTEVISAFIQMKINGVAIQTITPSLSLTYLEEVELVFQDYVSATGEERQFTFTIQLTNGSVDEYSGNDIYSVDTRTAAQATLPYLETFENTLVDWNIIDADQLFGWEQTTLPNAAGKALFINCYDYEMEGAIDKIYSPALDISSAEGLLLRFKLAYAQYPGVIGDALSVYALTDCSEDLTNATRVFFKEGSQLATTSTTSNYFIPSAADWETQFVLLNDFLGQSTLRLAFVSRNGYGNNIYIDDIEVIGTPITDLTILEVMEPSWVTCSGNVTPKLKIANQGSTAISGFSITASRNGNSLLTKNFTDELLPGEELDATLNSIAVISGQNDLTFEITPTNTSDNLPENNLFELPLRQITENTIIPVRENFDGNVMWSVVSSGTTEWAFENTNYDLSAIFPSYDNPSLTDQSWLVSPRLDLSMAAKASMFADFSYRAGSSIETQLTVAVSTDCGKTFTYSQPITNITEPESSAWFPSAEEDWFRKSFALNDFVGGDEVLIAIKATNQNDNNLFVDNIEFFESDDATPEEVRAPFEIYRENDETLITFNLQETQTVEVQVASIMGQLIAEESKENILNQTFAFRLPSTPALYIFKIRIGNKLYVLRQYLG
jgi:hypothetical protein